MGMSQEVRFKIGGDTKGLEASFQRAGQMAEQTASRIDKTFKRLSPERLAANRAAGRYLSESEFQSRQRSSGSSGSGGNGSGPNDGGGINWKSIASRFILGAAGVISNAVGSYFRRSAEMAQKQAEVSGQSLAGLRATVGAMGGLREQLNQGQRSVTDLERDMENQQNLVETLKGNRGSGIQQKYFSAQNALNPTHQALVDEQQNKLFAMQEKRDQQHQANLLLNREIERQQLIRETHLGREATTSRAGGGIGSNGNRDLGTFGVGREIGAIPERERAARAGQLSDLKAAQIELKRLRGEESAERKKGTAEQYMQAKLATRNQENVVKAERMKMEARRLDVNQELAGQTAEGRNFANGQRRPRSEAERLAQRAQQFRERARAAAITGAGGDIPMFLEGALRDEDTVSNKLSRATRGIGAQSPTTDETGIKVEISRSNALLEAIKNSLTTVNVN